MPARDLFGNSRLKAVLLLALVCFLTYFSFNQNGLSKTEEAFHYFLSWVGLQPDRTVVVPSNQILRPAGTQISFPGRPADMALSPDGETLALLNSSGIILINLAWPKNSKVLRPVLRIALRVDW
jgi:hypothetical protein